MPLHQKSSHPSYTSWKSTRICTDQSFTVHDKDIISDIQCQNMQSTITFARQFFMFLDLCKTSRLCLILLNWISVIKYTKVMIVMAVQNLWGKALHHKDHFFYDEKLKGWMQTQLVPPIFYITAYGLVILDTYCSQ